MKKSSVKFYDYHVWANKKIFNHLQSLPENVCTDELTSVFPSIKDALVHTYVIEQGWLSTLLGDESSDLNEMAERVKTLTKKAQSKNISGLEQLFDDLYEEFKRAFDKIDDFNQQTTVFFGQLECSYNDIVTHVVNHGTYHRGNITAMLRQQGYNGCATDYGLFLFEQK
ncbi:DinB family protein [Lysinibacillus sp. NPDC097287]|uniref:DinB family protein n=1 Tax=Lysinibacillus sp. NPDC097287 TaxID=3364144 RepID=UPI003813CD9C